MFNDEGSLEKIHYNNRVKVGFHTTDFIAIAQKAQELFVNACVELVKYRCTRYCF